MVKDYDQSGYSIEVEAKATALIEKLKDGHKIRLWTIIINKLISSNRSI